MRLAIALHILSAIVWVGGMFFAYVCLRPIAGSLLEVPQRLPLWSQVLGRFFHWVWLAVILLPTTGFWMAFKLFNGISNWPLTIQLMMGFGILMVLLFFHLFFAPYRRLEKALANADLKEAGRQLGQIRLIVAVNLTLGLLVSILGSTGRYL
ncbi:MAG: CopD family protein [Gammaproteobacteria bacterium]|nr:CopD family protein [Gammaproteobacteria bacterium]MCI0590985.1 CopD family protein [Gammaproteobacteria bacterium]